MTSANTTAANSPWPHRLAVLLVCATFPLIWVGGLVTTYDAGMAVADWPTTFGYNPFLYPWRTWVFGPWDVFIEHGHRLLGAAVGVIALALAAVTFARDRRRWMRGLALAVVAAVILQGLLGGARVIRDERLLAQVHGTFGPAFFALCVAAAVCTSRRWRDAASLRGELPAGAVRLAAATALVAYLQLALGARLRHMPLGGGTAEFQIVVAFHLSTAAVVLGHAAALAVRLRSAAESGARTPSRWLLGLVCLQIGLGGWTWVANYGWPGWFANVSWAGGYVVSAEGLLQSTVTTAHVAVGSLILALAVTVALRAGRAGRGRLRLPSLTRRAEAAA